MTGGHRTVGRVLYTVGAVPMALEQHHPEFIRRDFGARLMLLAVVSVVVGPVVAASLFSSPWLAVGLTAGVVVVTGFLAYCEMYRIIVEINDRVAEIDDGTYDVTFDADRPDEIGETFDLIERTAASLGEQVREAETAETEAREAREEAEAARAAAEQERAETAALSDHLETKAGAYRDTLAAVADGDLTARVEAESESQAMTEVGVAINETLGSLERLIAEGQSVSAGIADESDRVAERGREVRSQTESVRTAVDDIVDATDRQQTRLDDAASELSDLSATVEEMASSVTSIADRSDTAAERGRAAQQSSSAAQSAVDAIRHQSTTAAAEVRELDTIAEEMAEVLSVIDDIAEQTNMLALNASIEAARAGEAGEGFAVVADEIKGLAAETQAATTDVAALIGTLREQVGESVDAMSGMEDAVERGSDTISETITTLEEVVDATVAVNDSIQEVDRATDESAESAQEVVGIVDEITEIADGTATQAESVAETAAQQGAMVDDVVEAVTDFADDAGRLRADLSQFDAADAPAAAPSPADD